MSVQLLDRDGIAAKLRSGRTKADEVIRRPGFPEATYLFGHARWIEHEVDAWILAEIARERAVYGKAARSAA